MGVARLSTSGGQMVGKRRTFPHFPHSPDMLSMSPLIFPYFSSPIGSSGWTVRPPGMALATPLLKKSLIRLQHFITEFVEEVIKLIGLFPQ